MESVQRGVEASQGAVPAVRRTFAGKALQVFALSIAAVASAAGQNLEPAGSPKSRWSLSVGTAFRTISAGFSLKDPGLVPAGLLPGQKPDSGLGDVGLHVGGAENTTYDNGWVGRQAVGPRAPLLRGTAYAVIEDAAQLTVTTRRGRTPRPLYQAAFTTTSATYEYANRFSLRDVDSSARGCLGGPYLELRWAALRTPDVDANISLSYSWLYGNLGQGLANLGRGNVAERKTTVTYTYVYDFDAIRARFDGQTPEFPFVDRRGGIISSADAYNRGTRAEAVAPRKSQDSLSTTSSLASYYATGSASLNVRLHELALAPELSFHLMHRLRGGISAGPTLNIVDTKFTSEAGWFLAATGQPVVINGSTSNGTTMQLGAATQITVQLDITDRLYLEAVGSYRYVPSFTVTSGLATAALDLSSFQANVGLGLRF